jgi:hypothetical protein
MLTPHASQGHYGVMAQTCQSAGVDDERPPICPTCGVTMVPAALSATKERGGEWVCVECEESGEPDAA